MALYNAGSGKAANHPVQTVDWYDAVKWCNARSQQAGLTPVYYTDAGLTQVYTNGETWMRSMPNWSANGYRLPTEAEWEKAARGGLSGQRFPWGNTISESQANYYGDTNTWLRFWTEQLQRSFHKRSDALHESGGVICTKRIWTLRHGWKCTGVVLGLGWHALRPAIHQ